MKQLFLLLFILSNAFLHTAKSAPSDSLLLKRCDVLVAYVKNQFVPDGRTDIFSTAFTNDTLKVETTNQAAYDRLKVLIAQDKIPVTLIENYLPAKELKDKEFALVTLSVANHRDKPAHSAEMVTQTLLGTPLQILKQSGGYYLVRTPDRYISWVSSAEIETMTAFAFNKWKQAEKVVYLPEYGRAYTEASDGSLPVSDLVAGDILEVLESKGKYLKVSYPDKRVAYLVRKDTAPYQKWISRPAPEAKQILSTAEQFIGIPYLWGGTSVKGMDCSGFTKTCYYLNGIILARDASQQALYGEKVEIYDQDSLSIPKCIANLQAGDLLFFSPGGTKGVNPRITHTAIYIGKGKFIQAAGLIRINSMLKDDPEYDDFQSRKLVAARRILNSVGTPGISRIDQHAFYQTLSKRP
ncbi:hypothetical protein ADIARSV_4081 [Arcticibacter svalbardensis MN12-7]|uniref:NlpC/P60 domain-containing protein n=1 Tax=Arcticibacter svalbardensis MN12-7 TaxID=1150600 RepID=R9GV43_9SPHI|nr:C40 family peptidase [Arcticibacter svalbardensis]EOR92799.1 hypothetical protein ADIARSV_4081 [Arcticibacter svalbardensis MN12-7]